MAGTITTDFTTIDAADAITNWLSLGTWATAPLVNADMAVQGTNAVVGRLSANEAWVIASTTAVDLTTGGRHVFIWQKNVTWPGTDTKANGGLRISLSSDATPTLVGTAPHDGPSNSKSWYVGGKDTDLTTGWICYVVDPTSTPSTTGPIYGNVQGTPTMTGIQRAGTGAKVLSTIGAGNFKPVNIMTDIVKYGTGLTISNGTGQTPLGFTDIYSADSAQANAYGVLTKLSGIYYGAGKMTFGTTSQASITYFYDINEVLVYQNFPVNISFYEMITAGAASQMTTFQLGKYNTTTKLTSSGCTVKGAGDTTTTSYAVWTLTANAANQLIKLYGSTFSELKSAVLNNNTESLTVASCTTTNLSPTITTTNNFNTAGVKPGMLITGTGIAANTYVSSVDSNTQITASVNATAGGTVTLTFAHSSELRSCTFSDFSNITTNGCLIDSCTFRGVTTTAPISGTWALIAASPTEVSNITNCSFISCNKAIKISTAGTYTFNNLTFSGNSYDIENASVATQYAADTVVQSAGITLNSGGVVGVGESFTGTGGTLSSVKFILQKTGTPTGNAVAKIYAHSGTYGTSSVPTGTALATSDNFNVANLTTSYATYSIQFSGSNNFALVNGTNYVLTLEYSGGDASNNIQVGYETTNGWAGNYSTETGVTWTADSTKDVCFYVYTGGIVTVNATSGANPGTFTNTGNGSTTINNSVNITITALDPNGAAVSGAQVVVLRSSDKVELMASTTTTNASGIATTTYNYLSDTPVIIRVRLDSSGGTRYFPYEATGTIKSTGLAVTANLILDTIAQ